MRTPTGERGNGGRGQGASLQLVQTAEGRTNQVEGSRLEKPASEAAAEGGGRGGAPFGCQPNRKKRLLLPSLLSIPSSLPFHPRPPSLSLSLSLASIPSLARSRGWLLRPPTAQRISTYCAANLERILQLLLIHVIMTFVHICLIFSVHGIMVHERKSMGICLTFILSSKKTISSFKIYIAANNLCR